MNLQSYFHYTIFLIFLSFAIYTTITKVRLKLYVPFALLFFCLALWSLSFAFINNPYVDKNVLDFIIDVASIANLGFGILTFISISLFTEYRKGEKFIYPLLGIYLIFCIYYQATGQLANVVNNNNTFQYWKIDYGNKILTIFINIIHNSLIALSFIKLYRFIHNTSNNTRKKQGKIILYTGLISFILGFINVYGSNLLQEKHFIPYIPDFFLLIFATGILYSITKYKLFQISPFTVADKILELMPAGLLLTDERDQITTVNNSLINLTGYKLSEVVGLKIKDWIDDLQMKAWVEQENQNVFQTKLTSKNNHVYDIIISYEGVFDDQHRLIGTIYVMEDVTKLVKTQDELIQLNNTLEQKVKARTNELEIAIKKVEESDKLKTAFLSNMSHEIRTPMNGILGFSQLLQNDSLTNEKRNNYLKLVINSGHRLLNIVNDVLDISKLESGDFHISKKPLCLNEIMMEEFAFFAEKANEKNITLKAYKDTEDDKSTIFSDKKRIKQVLHYLLDNAFKFTTQGYIDFGYQMTDGYIEIFVKDTGIGVNHEYHHKIFKPFYQVESGFTRKYEGTGIGLAIAKKIVELLGGSIWVESQENSGAAFFFTIPHNPTDD